MKLVFRGHDERYVVEQSLMNLFPGELPVYEPITPGDDSWAVISLETGTSPGGGLPSAGGGKTTGADLIRAPPAAISSGRASAATPSAPASSWRPGRSPA